MSANRQRTTVTLYWMGIIRSVLCVALTCMRNTELVGRFEHAGFPLSWAAGVMAIIAFLAAEYCEPVPARQPVPVEVSQSLPWENEFAD
jgi:hypothetical protein